MDIIRKNRMEYLDVAINGHGDEKVSLTLEALRRLDVSASPLSELHVVEVGPGGGVAIDSLATGLESRVELKRPVRLSVVELGGVASKALNLSMEKARARGIDVEFFEGELQAIDKTFNQEEEADVVAASAVMHEVYSYGGGYSAVDTAIGSITKVIKPGGYFAFRDVYSVDRLSQHERVRHSYDNETWVKFIKLFLPHYLANAQHPYHRLEDRVVLRQNLDRVKAIESIDSLKTLTVEGPIGLMREMQRHYITLRDYLWRTGVLGVEPFLEGEGSFDWIDYRRGHKRVNFRLMRDDPILESLSEKKSDNRVRSVDGDVFDVATDIFLADFLTSVEHGGEAAQIGVWNDWLLREGAESYVYLTLNNLIGSVALESYNASQGEKILIPVRPSDVFVAPRLYYNRYLEKTLNNPLYDGKQAVLFKMLPVANPTKQERREALRSLELVAEHCSKEVLALLYDPVRKLTG